MLIRLTPCRFNTATFSGVSEPGFASTVNSRAGSGAKWLVNAER